MIRKYLFPILAIAGCCLAASMVIKRSRADPPPLETPVPAPQAPFEAFVAAPGLTEASTENISIGSPLGGIVRKVYVQVGDRVKAGDSLFELDDRNLRAALAVQEAALKTAGARTQTASATLEEAREQFGFLDPLSETGAVSKQSIASRRSQVTIAEARVEEAKGEIVSAEAAIASIKTQLEQLTVRAPVDGSVLQVRIRPGEFATAGPVSTPFVLLGNIDQLHIRVDVDEDNAWKVRAGAKAVAHVRGNRDLETQIEFVRFEPFVVPKQSLTGFSTERVDTRVLQVIYLFDRADLPIFVGQQMDVFIEASSASATDGK